MGFAVRAKVDHRSTPGLASGGVTFDVQNEGYPQFSPRCESALMTGLPSVRRVTAAKSEERSMSTRIRRKRSVDPAVALREPGRWSMACAAGVAWCALVLGSVDVAISLERGENDVLVRVVDTGPGLCCVVVMPGDHYMIYDAGYFQGLGERHCMDSVQELVPDDATIDLMVLSHSDADHLGVADEILDAYTVKRVLHLGYERSTRTWEDADRAIKLEKEREGCVDINLRYFEYPPGATYRFGDVFVTMVAGFHTPPAEWGPLNTSESRNAGSIVVRLYYKQRSVLFAGDTVGRHIGNPPDKCIAAEKFMVDNREVIPIDSDVLIAPHHGADNGSATCFIQAVSPQFVIFSAGHDYEHPRAAAAQRYLTNGVQLQNMFRTDLGDDEGGDEWSHGRVAGQVDPPADDDVDILLSEAGDVAVAYRTSP